MITTLSKQQETLSKLFNLSSNQLKSCDPLNVPQTLRLVKPL